MAFEPLNDRFQTFFSSALCNIGTWTAAALTVFLCTAYTFIGGLKAVIWVDVFQCVTIISGFLSIIVVGANNFGGLGNILTINQEGGRIFFDDFRASLTIRTTFWCVVIGGTFGVWGGIYTNQSMIQRYMACKNIYEAKKSVFINILGLWTIMICAGLCGHVAYAYSQFCSPVNAGFIDKKDQLIPYLSVDILKHLPGMAGLYAAAVYAGTLSTLSGGINATAALLLRNYIKPFVKLSAETEERLRNTLVIASGFIIMGVSVLASVLGDSVLVAGLTCLGMIGGPCMGLFLLGILCPLADRATGLTSFIVGNLVAIYLFIGYMFIGGPTTYELSPLYHEGAQIPDLNLEGKAAEYNRFMQNDYNTKHCLCGIDNRLNQTTWEAPYNAVQHFSLNYTTSFEAMAQKYSCLSNKTNFDYA